MSTPDRCEEPTRSARLGDTCEHEFAASLEPQPARRWDHDGGFGD